MQIFIKKRNPPQINVEGTNTLNTNGYPLCQGNCL